MIYENGKPPKIIKLGDKNMINNLTARKITEPLKVYKLDYFLKGSEYLRFSQIINIKRIYFLMYNIYGFNQNPNWYIYCISKF